MKTWAQAWADALYGPDGFYRKDGGPAAHFATSAQGIPGVTEIFASAILALAQDHGVEVIVDFASGRGELLRTLAPAIQPASSPKKTYDIDGVNSQVVASEPHKVATEHGETEQGNIALIGIDVVERPADLPESIDWVISPGGAVVPDMSFLAGRRALVVAHEWLDVVPLTIAEADQEGVLREVLVSEDGAETMSAHLSDGDVEWAKTWWPGPYAPGERVEIGLSRDGAWANLCAEVEQHGGEGSAILGVDYGHLRVNRPGLGTLTGFRGGSECLPIPDTTCDITAHVAIDSLNATTVITQRDMLIELFGNIAAQPVDHALASSDPREYLARLSARSAFGAAIARDGLGDFYWFTR